eukprot:scaffold96639_cov21-Tisochrysis_lutea.AAC.1
MPTPLQPAALQSMLTIALRPATVLTFATSRCAQLTRAACAMTAVAALRAAGGRLEGSSPLRAAGAACAMCSLRASRGADGSGGGLFKQAAQCDICLCTDQADNSSTCSFPGKPVTFSSIQ